MQQQTSDSNSSSGRDVDGPRSSRSWDCSEYVSSNGTPSSTSTPPVGCKQKRKMASSSKAPAKKHLMTEMKDYSGSVVNKYTSTLTKDDVIHLFETANISSTAYKFLVPTKNRKAANPPEGYITVYAEQICAGLRFPLHHFVVDICNFIEVSPSQLEPNSQSLIVGFILCAKLYGFPLIVGSFFSLFTVQACRTQKMFQFVPHRGKKVNFLIHPHCSRYHCQEFFFLRRKGKSWNCLTTWSETYSKPIFNPGLFKLVVDKGILDHHFQVNKLLRRDILVHGRIEPGVPSTELSFRFLMHKAAVKNFELLPEDKPTIRATTKVTSVTPSNSSSPASGSVSPKPDDDQTLPTTELPESIPPQLRTLHQVVESLYVSRECYQKLEKNVQELASELALAKARIQELEQERADYKERTSRYIKNIEHLL